MQLGKYKSILSRDRGVCLGIFAPALVLGQRDNGTSRPVETLIRKKAIFADVQYSIYADILWVGGSESTKIC